MEETDNTIIKINNKGKVVPPDLLKVFFEKFKGLSLMRILYTFLLTPCRILLIAVFLFCIGCSSYQYNDPFFGKDKFYHFTGAMIIGSGATIAAKSNGYNKNDAPVIGTSVAFTVGMGKEFYDLTVKETFWSWKDLFWDLAGGAAGSYLMIK